MPEKTEMNNVQEDMHMMCIETISGINQVQGFNPAAVTKEVLSETGEKEHFLPLIWKKAWARMVHPLHRCHAKVTEIKDGYVAAYAQFYVDNDPSKEAIGEGFAFMPIDGFAPDPVKARNDAVSLALGSAKSRAYTDAGFGYQFWTDDCMDVLQNAAAAQSGSMANAVSAVACGETGGMEVGQTGQEADAGKEVPLASMVALSSSVQGGVPVQQETQKQRKSQYEVAKAENEELAALADQLVQTVECMMTATAGSAEHGAAEKTLEGIREKWFRLSTDIETKMKKPSVQEAKAADSGYSFFAKTYDQVVAEAEAAVRQTPAVTEVPQAPASGDAETSPKTDTVEGTDTGVCSGDSQMTLFGMSEADARAVVSTCGAYSGKTVGELYENKVTRAILPKLFERTTEKNERMAIRTMIEADAELMAYCSRNGKDLSIA